MRSIIIYLVYEHKLCDEIIKYDNNMLMLKETLTNQPLPTNIHQPTLTNQRKLWGQESLVGLEPGSSQPGVLATPNAKVHEVD